MSKTIKMAAGDIYRNPQGRTEWVSGIDKLAQDAAYHQMTPYDPDADIGNELITAVPIVSGLISMRGIVARYIRDAIGRLEKHHDALLDIISQDEKFGCIRTLTVKNFKEDPNSFLYYLVIENAAGDGTTIAKVVDLSHQDVPNDWYNSINAGG